MLRGRYIMGDLFESNIVDKKKITSEIKRTKHEKTLISTGSKNFNKAIGGGFFSGKSYVIFGANKTGKLRYVINYQYKPLKIPLKLFI